MLAETKGPQIKIMTQIIEGHAAKDIIQFATTHDIDLIVISTHGLSGEYFGVKCTTEFGI